MKKCVQFVADDRSSEIHCRTRLAHVRAFTDEKNIINTSHGAAFFRVGQVATVKLFVKFLFGGAFARIILNVRLPPPPPPTLEMHSTLAYIAESIHM